MAEGNSKEVDNILDLNDDCLLKIMKYLKLIDLCAAAKTCKRFELGAREAFRSKRRSYGIPRVDVKFEHHQRILNIFGDIVKEFECIVNFFNVGISGEQMKLAFKWMERYCESLEKIRVIGAKDVILPKSAMRVMAKVKGIDLMAPIPDNNLRAALLDCKEVVDLKLSFYTGPFHFPDHRFPSLRTLINRVQVGPRTSYNQIETFFKNHKALTSLETQFLSDGGLSGSNGTIDLTYLKHLTSLTKLKLTLSYSKIIGVHAFTYLKKLQEFYIDGSDDPQTDTKILENLASVDSLMKLSLGFSDISHLIAGIGRFKKLSNLKITNGHMGPHDGFLDANIASLAQLNNSSCTELQVSCLSLSEPESLVNIVRNLKAVQSIGLFCEVALSETICKQLVEVCTSQGRKIRIILEKESIGEMNFDFSFIDKFNKEFGALVFVEIKV